ncbi:hypothetical protein CLV98_12519 [Dyadobacter jejuensis]|uniref:Uncharacterized protein n=1 Tax=Dyadobacter jejuensis TaxID=1082580 RepID=A0A316A5P7_9BACT|nr:hypothetical protein CLV98_12519 [Dyadobacter jejuensis]
MLTGIQTPLVATLVSFFSFLCPSVVIRVFLFGTAGSATRRLYEPSLMAKIANYQGLTANPVL